ncbi:hypothetical protein KIN20_037082 [Parelaphostrongylus tenuis]|uniref:Uncharacterized protein n=1 Tax=Parelaphostrongylus tenuis TaxID=148309 RepID=A0AAD5RHC6_PARTN|nr:hypothetical protein KIN20_037082 [Parelaphostrongylus tenuis]
MLLLHWQLGTAYDLQEEMSVCFCSTWKKVYSDKQNNIAVFEVDGEKKKSIPNNVEWLCKNVCVSRNLNPDLTLCGSVPIPAAPPDRRRGEGKGGAIAGYLMILDAFQRVVDFSQQSPARNNERGVAERIIQRHSRPASISFHIAVKCRHLFYRHFNVQHTGSRRGSP